MSTQSDGTPRIDIPQTKLHNLIAHALFVAVSLKLLQRTGDKLPDALAKEAVEELTVPVLVTVRMLADANLLSTEAMHEILVKQVGEHIADSVIKQFESLKNVKIEPVASAADILAKLSGSSLQ